MRACHQFNLRMPCGLALAELIADCQLLIAFTKEIVMKPILLIAVISGTFLAAQEPRGGNPPPAQQPQSGAQQPAAGTQAAPAGQSNVSATLHVYAYPNKGQTQDQQFKDNKIHPTPERGPGPRAPQKALPAEPPLELLPVMPAPVRAPAR
jgi:hypothetical protein